MRVVERNWWVRRVVVAVACAVALLIPLAAGASADCGVTIHCTPLGRVSGAFCKPTTQPPCTYTPPAPPVDRRTP